MNVNNSRTFVQGEMKDADSTGHIQDKHGLDNTHRVEGNEITRIECSTPTECKRKTGQDAYKRII